MTPEQRFTKIENLLQTITEIQARHEGDFAELKESQKELKESQKKTDEQISRLAESMNRLSDMQERTEFRLVSLIEHVDRVVARIDKLEQ
jgi:ABC-type transporter Mla subunit MlaD